MSSLYQEADLSTLKSSVLVYVLVCVAIHPVLRGEGHFVEVAAVLAAFAGLDEHGRPLEALSIRAHEAYGHSARAAWRAASTVRAHAAVVGPIETDTHAFPVGQVEWLGGFLGRGAAFPSLCRDSQAVAGPYGADSGLPLQLALKVSVGDPGGNTHPTAAGALGPVSSLEWTRLLLQLFPLRQVFVSMLILPAVGELVGEDQLILCLMRRRMVPRSR